MSNYIDMAAGTGIDIVCIPLTDGASRTTVTADVAKAICPCKGTVVAVSAWVDTIGGTTKPTDVDLTVEKGTTDLHTAIAAVGSSTNAGPQMGALSTTAATLRVAAGDIFHLDASITGGASMTVVGIHAQVFVAREASS